MRLRYNRDYIVFILLSHTVVSSKSIAFREYGTSDDIQIKKEAQAIVSNNRA